MRVLNVLAAAAIAVAAVSVTSDAFAQRGGRNQSSTAVVLNYERVLGESALGRDIQSRLGQIRQEIGQEAQSLAPEQQSLEQERQRLAGVTRNMSPEQIRNSADFQQFQQRLQQLEGRAQSLQGDFQCTQLLTLREFDRQVTPIVRSVMESRGAGIVLDARSVQFTQPEFDITSAVIEQLDQASRSANVTRHSVSECQQQSGQ
ncbi:MAG: OmpH family outer membrane protein [Hyphomonadaceae bacterium]